MGESIECYAESAGLCPLMDPASPRYNLAYKDVFIRQSRVMAGLEEFVPPDPEKAPGWLQDALTGRGAVQRPSLPGNAPGGSQDVMGDTPENASNQPPTIWQQAKNLAGAVARHAIGGFTTVSEEKFRERISICEGCEFFSKERKCLKCGCFMDIKARWGSEKCPIDKWPAETEGLPTPNSLPTHPPPEGGCGCHH